MYARIMGYKVVFIDYFLYGFVDVGSIYMNKVLQFILVDVIKVICVFYISKENIVLRLGIFVEKVYVILNVVDIVMFKFVLERFLRD